MQIIVIDYSGKIDIVKRHNLIIARALSQISTRIHFGNVPMRVIDQIGKKLNRLASRASCLLILTPDKREINGWKILKIGAKNIAKKLSLPQYLISANKEDVISMD